MGMQPASVSIGGRQECSNHGVHPPVLAGPGPYKGTRGFNLDIRNEHVSPAAELISFCKKYFLINYF